MTWIAARKRASQAPRASRTDEPSRDAPASEAYVAICWGRMMAAANGVAKRKAPGGTVASRIAGERPPVRPEDQRRARATGRDKQLNLKVSAEFRDELRTLARTNSVGMNEMLERILAEWKAAQ
jgi:hypothetical protein